jgi:hypothetical protein
MIKHLSLLILIQFTLNSYSQFSGDIPSIGKEDLPGAEFSSTRTFKGESLYGYIDGGADLYIEYGFSDAVVTGFELGKRKIKIEIYRMDDPEAAYGIFSVSRFRCRNRPDFTVCTCQNKYQLQICKGNYYISIINESGTGEDSTISLVAGKALSDKIDKQSADLADFFPEVSPEILRNDAYLVKGRLGILNSTPDLDNYFKGAGGFTALLLKNSEKTRVSVRFINYESLKRFCELHDWQKSLLTGETRKMAGGETVRRTSDITLLIEIPSN